MDEQSMIKKAMEASNNMLDEYASKQKIEQSGGVSELPDVPETEEEAPKPLESTSQDINKALDPQEEVRENDNWRKAREARRKLEMENEELRRMLESRGQHSNQPQQVEYQEENLEFEDFIGNEEDDTLATTKQVKKLVEQNKVLAKTVKQMKQAQKIESAEYRLMLNFPDYWKVVTPESLKKLKEEMPGTSEIVRTQPDPYLQHVAAYEAIKKLNVAIKNEEEYMPSKVKVTNNAAKPKTISNMATSSQETPLSALKNHFGPLSEDEKARWRKIADDAIAGIN